MMNKQTNLHWHWHVSHIVYNAIQCQLLPKEQATQECCNCLGHQQHQLCHKATDKAGGRATSRNAKAIYHEHVLEQRDERKSCLMKARVTPGIFSEANLAVRTSLRCFSWKLAVSRRQIWESEVLLASLAVHSNVESRATPSSNLGIFAPVPTWTSPVKSSCKQSLCTKHNLSQPALYPGGVVALRCAIQMWTCWDLYEGLTWHHHFTGWKSRCLLPSIVFRIYLGNPNVQPHFCRNTFLKWRSNSEDHFTFSFAAVRSASYKFHTCQ